MNSGCFKKGNIPWNKGVCHNPIGSQKTQFKKGKMTGEDHYSWKGGVQKNKVDCVYLYSGPCKRVRRPRKIYEEHYGLIPEGCVIAHKDGNKYNDDPENLEAISRAENMKRNSNRR